MKYPGSFRKSLLFSVILMLISFCGISQAMPKEPFDNSGSIVARQTFLHFREWKPDTVRHSAICLLIHGFSGSTFSWRYTAPALAASGYRVVAVDVPPFGFSDRNPKLNASVTARAAVISQFMELYSSEAEWYIVGHSMGGGIAQALALMYPDKVKGLCFVAGALFSSVKKTEASSFWLLRFKPVAGLLVALSEEYFITPGRIKKLLFSAYQRLPEEDEVQGYLIPLMQSGTSKALIGSVARSFEIADVEAHPIKIPLLAIWGDKDSWVPLEYSSEVLRIMNIGNIRIIADAGHCPMETHPDEFNALLLEYLEQLP